MSFTNAYNEVLSPFLKKFKEEKNEKLKKGILKNTAEAVVKSKDTLEVQGDHPKDLEKVCFFVSLFPFLLSSHFSAL